MPAVLNLGYILYYNHAKLFKNIWQIKACNQRMCVCVCVCVHIQVICDFGIMEN